MLHCRVIFTSTINKLFFTFYRIRAHDQVMHAANRLIPVNMREHFHLLIGSRLLMNTPEDDLEKSIFGIVGHLNKGARLVDTHDQKYEVCKIVRDRSTHLYI